MLVALTVLAIALLAALRASSAGVQNTVEIRNRLLAGWVAQNRLAEHIARRDWLPIGEMRGEESQGGVRFRLGGKSRRHAQFPVQAHRDPRVCASRNPEQALASLTGFMVKPGG